MQLIGKAGQGAYGIVYHGQWKGQQVVVKRNLVHRKTDGYGVLREHDILKQVNGHPFLVRLLATSHDNPFTEGKIPTLRQKDRKDDSLWFIFEEAQNDVHRFFTETRPAMALRKQLMVHFLLGMEYLHQKNIVHWDLKPENLLIFRHEDRLELKICDFGMALPDTRQYQNCDEIMTPWYRSPEICLHHLDCGKPSDVWSVGCILYEMVTGHAILTGVSQTRSRDILKAILERIPFPETSFADAGLSFQPCPKSFNDFVGEIPDFDTSPGSRDQFVSLLRRLLSLDPVSRPTVTEILDDPFFEFARPTITLIRQECPVVDIEPVITVRQAYRSIVTPYVQWLYTNRYHHPWYSHRLLFQSLDLFDRFVETAKPTTNDDTFAIYLTCLYSAIKYFDQFGTKLSFSGMIQAQYRTPATLKKCEAYQRQLLDLVSKPYGLSHGQIYRPTLFEAWPRRLAGVEIKALLDYYCQLEVEQVSLSSLRHPSVPI